MKSKERPSGLHVKNTTVTAVHSIVERNRRGNSMARPLAIAWDRVRVVKGLSLSENNRACS